MQHVRHGAFEVSQTAEQRLKDIALIFGLLSAAVVVFDSYPYTMFFHCPFARFGFIVRGCAVNRS